MSPGPAIPAATSPGATPVTVARAALPHALHALVQQLKQLAKHKSTDGLYRQIVRRGLESELPVGEFQDRLRAAGLVASRASELARIQAHFTAADYFLHPQHLWSFRDALRLARGRTSRPPKSDDERLDEHSEELVAAAGGAGPWTFDCGLFRLRFDPGGTAPESRAPEAAAAPGEHLGLPLAPDTEGNLSRLARHRGIGRAAAAVQLLQRAPWPLLLAALPDNAGAGQAETPRERDDARYPLPPQQAATAAAPGTFPLHRRKNAAAFSLQRRKNPARTPADICRLPVVLPPDLAARLTRLGQACGLSRPEIASWLLEPDPVGRVRAVQAALARVRQDRNANPYCCFRA